MKIEEIIRVNAKGFGFIDTDNESYFVPAAFINGAMDGDLVLVEVKDDKYSDDKKVARVKRIVKRNTVKVVAEITMAKGKVKIIPDDKRITKTLKIASGVTVKTGEKVILELKDHTRDYIWCEVVEVIGHKDDPGTDILSIVHTHGIPTEFDIDVLKQAKNISQEVLPKEYDGRKDLRDKVVITIDGETAKDLDDAICVERLDNGNYFLGVYIADVSHYVKENSLIDLSAYERGTSVYLADRVIPMLPRDLSNGICSLNGNVDRLVIGCEMEITPKGNVVNREIIEGVINTKHRMTYTDVNKILKNNKETTDKYGDIVDMVFASFDLSHAIRHAKVERGMIDFDLPEPEIIVDKTGKAIDVIKKDRGESERIIEDFMVIANETVARLFDDNELTGIYRIHELPEEKKLAQFYTFLKTIGISVTAKYEDVQPKDIQTILNQIHDRVEFPVIASMLLRSMQKAIYSKECLGHFGIGASHYTHFTSPIRRYPDLIVHRLLREYFINGDTSKKTVRSWDKRMDKIAEDCSNAERRAIQCERDVNDMKMAEYAMEHIGTEFNGIITSVQKFGFFVRLESTMEGLVSIDNIPNDDYNYIEDSLMLKGRTSGMEFKLADQVKIFIKSANKDEGKIDFGLVEFKDMKPKIIKANKGYKSKNENNSRKQKS